MLFLGGCKIHINMNNFCYTHSVEYDGENSRGTNTRRVATYMPESSLQMEKSKQSVSLEMFQLIISNI